MNEREKLAEIETEIGRLKERLEYIVAKHTKVIWTSEEYSIEKHGYNFVGRIREAELGIRLHNDKEYMMKKNRMIQLRAERIELGGSTIDLGDYLL